MLKLKLQYFSHLMRRVDSLEKTLMLGGIEGRRRGDDRGWDGWMASPTRWTWVWVNSGSWWWTGRPGVLLFMESQRDTTEWLNWTELNANKAVKKWELELSSQRTVPKVSQSGPSLQGHRDQLHQFPCCTGVTGVQRRCLFPNAVSYFSTW